MIQNDRFEILVIKSLLYNDEYVKRVLPFIQDSYFLISSESYVVRKIQEFINEYNNRPTKEALLIKASHDTLSQNLYEQVVELLTEVDPSNYEKPDLSWLVEQTEIFCQNQAIHNAIMESVQIIGGEHKTLTKGAIPELLSDALSISFDPNIGHDYFKDFDKRFEYYHNVEERIPFDIDYLNQVTNGGVPRKTLNVILAGVNVGKSLCLCHLAAASVSRGLNVLYITLELPEMQVAERIDANLMDIKMKDLRFVDKNTFQSKMIKFQDTKSAGILKIKEYPTASANVNHFKVLLNEYKLKDGFVPDVIYVDYLNIMTSYRISAQAGMYSYVKSIAEELRGLASECDVPIFTATQTTRSGFKSSDIGLEDTSESFGLPATADFMIGVTRSEELDDLHQLKMRVIKTRYNDNNSYKSFVVGVDIQKMRLYDTEQTSQTLSDDIIKREKKDTPVFDSSDFGQGMKAEKRETFDDWDMEF